MFKKENSHNQPEKKSAEYCPACNSDSINDRWFTRRIRGLKEVLWCANCGFGWQAPLPTTKEITEYYESFPPYILQGAKEKEMGFTHRVRYISELIPNYGKLLDIGSGLGYFLKLAQREGWEVTGVEPQSSAAEYCKKKMGIKVQVGFVEDMNIKPKSFDVVTLWDVWEHVHNPLSFLDRCIEIVKPGGLLVISIPNSSGWPARLFRGQWRYVMFTHLSYFTMNYVKKTMAARGLDIERACNMIKVQSLIDGIASWLPVEIDTERMIRMGRKDSIERGRPEQVRSNTWMEQSLVMSKILGWIREQVFKINFIQLPWAVGDIVDLYCRKK